jgi:hypothetical protein
MSTSTEACNISAHFLVPYNGDQQTYYMSVYNGYIFHQQISAKEKVNNLSEHFLSI